MSSLTNRSPVILGNKIMTEGLLLDGGCIESGGGDCNSNDIKTTTEISCLSNASSQDIGDFVQDNSEYQWFLDYGCTNNSYRDASGLQQQHTSILSSLNESYCVGGDVDEINYYDALSKNLDANLAEADMESFRTEDIHALLTTLPTICTDMQLASDVNREGEMFASITPSLLSRFAFISPESSPVTLAEGEEDNDDDEEMVTTADDDVSSTMMSLCKSELLFSPVREIPVLLPGGGLLHFSADSLDCDLEQDIMLTCQANKDNYTIAFEGSVTTISDDSEEFRYTDKSDSAASNSLTTSKTSKTLKNLHQKQIETSTMAQSDSGLTTWSKLKNLSTENQLQRLPSENNNNNNSCSFSEDKELTSYINDNILNDNTLKSQSMPNIAKKLREKFQCKKSPIDQWPNLVKVFDIQHQSRNGGSFYSEMTVSVDGDRRRSRVQKQTAPVHNLNLVHLFMKQKSNSAEGMSQSSASYYSSSTNQNTNESFELLQNKQIINDNLSTKSTQVKHQKQSSNCNLNNNVTQRKIGAYKPQTTLLISGKNTASQILNKSMQTSKVFNRSDNVRLVEPSFLTKLKQANQKSIYVIYPNYALPNLDFLNEKHSNNIRLAPQQIQTRKLIERNRRFSCNDLESLKKKGFSHVKDLDSLAFLLPTECQQILSDVPEFADALKRKEISFELKDDCLENNWNHHFVNSKQNEIKLREKIIPDDQKQKIKKPLNYECSTQMSIEYLNKLKEKEKNCNCSDQKEKLKRFLNFDYNIMDLTEKFKKNQPLKLKEKQRPVSCDFPELNEDSLSNKFLEKRKFNDFHEIDLKYKQRPLSYDFPEINNECLNNKQKEKRKSCDCNSSVSSTATQPSSGFRGSSTILLSDSAQNNQINLNPLFVYRYDSITSCEASLSQKSKSKLQHGKIQRTVSENFVETEDEGIYLDQAMDNGVLSDKPETSIQTKSDCWSCSELEQLEEYLKMSGFSHSDTDDMTENDLLKLKSCVTTFLELKINRDPIFDFTGKKFLSFADKINLTPPNSPNVSAHKHFKGKNLTTMPICEESEMENISLAEKSLIDVSQKIDLVTTITTTTQALLHHLTTSSFRESASKIVLSGLCPTLYSLLSDGLKSNLETSFGVISNSVWQVVEASAQQGPLTQALNELVMRINSEGVMTEGNVKFNAFVIGLLNVRSLDAWLNYLRTRESILRRHYEPYSFLMQAAIGKTQPRVLFDALIVALEPLASLQFNIDLMYECKQLQRSFRRMEKQQFNKLSTHQNVLSSAQTDTDEEEISVATIINAKQRPRSCIDSTLHDDIAATVKKRWSAVGGFGTKFGQAVEKFIHDADEEDYSDSLEQTWCTNEVRQSHEITSEEALDSLDAKPLNGQKFRRLQQRWELLSGRGDASPPNQTPPISPKHKTPITGNSNAVSTKSKIPRLVNSPIKSPSSTLPKFTSKLPLKKATTPPGKKSPATTPVTTATTSNITFVNGGKKNTVGTRTSRVDQLEHPENRVHPIRPSSLPYRPVSGVQGAKGTKVIPQRRAVSSSVNRKPQQQQHQVKIPKVVRTLNHRLPSDNGHLSFNEGEKLKVILEVDAKWLLCCRGDQKGLVPKSSVISIT